MDFRYKANKKVVDVSVGFNNNALEVILSNRGVENYDEFLHVNESHLEDIELYDNIGLATSCYKHHLENEDEMALIVDFDFDGYSSSAVMYLYSKLLAAKINKKLNITYIIHSKKEHGLTDDIMEELNKKPYKLVIVPDAGSDDFKQHEILRNNGVNIIVLDHHNCDAGYSENAIVVNNQLSSKITNKAMTGVGVVYKFCKLLDIKYSVNFADLFIDLVAVGMIADNCDLRNLESRYLILKGLKLIENKENNNKFIATIYSKKAYSMKNEVTIDGISFYIAPFVNCIIRGGDFETKKVLFEAFIGATGEYTDEVRGKGLITYTCPEDYMGRMYDKLYRLQTKSITEHLSILESQIIEFGLNKNEVMILNGNAIENSVYNRVVVNRLTNKHKKHCILLKTHDGKLKGSASGCSNKEITDFRNWCISTGLFEYAAGHAMAFGVCVKPDKINQLYDLVSTIESEDVLTYVVDGIFNATNLNKNIIYTIGNYSNVWGNTVSKPLFAITDLILNKNDIKINTKGTTLTIVYNNIKFIKFNIQENTYDKIMENEFNKFTVIGSFEINRYNDTIEPQITIEDFKFEKHELINKPVDWTKPSTSQQIHNPWANVKPK